MLKIALIALLVAAGSKKKAVVKEEAPPAPQPTYQGTLPPEEIRATVGKDGAKIGKCYQDELTKNKDLRGRVHTTFIVEADGSVAAVKVRKNTLGNTVVEQCLVDHLKTLSFPKPAGDGMVMVNYPFNFNPQGAPPLENDTTPAADAGSLDIVGELAPSAVTAAADKNKEALDKCFAEETKRAPKVAEGTLTAMYIVDKEGKVERSFLKDTTVPSPRFEHCVLENIKTWTVEKPAWGRAYVTQPLSFVAAPVAPAPAKKKQK